MFSQLLRTVIILFTVTVLAGCHDQKLLDNLTQEQANQVLAILQQHNIAAQKDGTLKAGYTVTVTPSESTAALSIINQYQLPWAAEVQIGQAFPDSSLVASPNAEQARVLSLQEQRLEQSLRIIAQVVNARVHVSYPAFNTSSNKKSPNHVGVLISYKGEIDDNMFISQIKSLIKNSLDDVQYENISVVLFPAPVIQYSPPLTVPAEAPSPLLILLVVIIICSLATATYLLYKSGRIPGLRRKEPLNLKEEEPPAQ
ncbi:type III secretion system inner membrane ring lipoprotein SctJ [Salmonella enterica]